MKVGKTTIKTPADAIHVLEKAEQYEFRIYHTATEK